MSKSSGKLLLLMVGDHHLLLDPIGCLPQPILMLSTCSLQWRTESTKECDMQCCSCSMNHECHTGFA
ncbi:hypothetical protein Dimus_029847 [Dionaea muscipula]